MSLDNSSYPRTHTEVIPLVELPLYCDAAHSVGRGAVNGVVSVIVQPIEYQNDLPRDMVRITVADNCEPRNPNGLSDFYDIIDQVNNERALSGPN